LQFQQPVAQRRDGRRPASWCVSTSCKSSVGLPFTRTAQARGCAPSPSFECGLHRTYISGVERAVHDLTVAVQEKIAKALKATSSRLLDEPVRRSRA
jgi:hypothetical protein